MPYICWTLTRREDINVQKLIGFKKHTAQLYYNEERRTFLTGCQRTSGLSGAAALTLNPALTACASEPDENREVFVPCGFCRTGAGRGRETKPVAAFLTHLALNKLLQYLFSLKLFKRLSQLRNNHVQVAHDAKIRNVEYRGAAVLIDSDYKIRFLHAGNMLYCA